MLKDVSQMTQSELAAREEAAAPVLVTDKRRNFDETAETNATQDVEPVHPELMPEGATDGLPKQEAPPKPPVMHVPSLLGGTIQYTVGELFPWKGVFFLIADVKTDPAPHMIIVPVDHTGAHKKLAKSKKFGRG